MTSWMLRASSAEVRIPLPEPVCGEEKEQEECSCLELGVIRMRMAHISYAQREDTARHVHHDVLDAPTDGTLALIVVPRLGHHFRSRHVELEKREEDDKVEPDEPA